MANDFCLECGEETIEGKIPVSVAFSNTGGGFEKRRVCRNCRVFWDYKGLIRPLGTIALLFLEEIE